MEVVIFFLGLFLMAEAFIYHSTFTDMGIIVGKIDDAVFRNRRSKIVTYLGIPYAQRQTGTLRFQKPFPNTPFKEPYNATFFRPSCPNSFDRKMDNFLTSEDCLFLNIYAPVESTINPQRKYPILIYLHGGEFLKGSPQAISPEVLTFMGDVIVVTISFRVGVLGFLNTGNEHMPGNYGLWDQHLAIRWVRFNMAAFGGDVERITLIGQETGATSALLQAMYPGNRDLFQRVIAMSSVQLDPWALTVPNAELLGKRVGCAGINITQEEGPYHKDDLLADCLRNIPVSELLMASKDLPYIGPVIDHRFITEHPYNILLPVNNNQSDSLDFFRSLDIVIGMNDNNGDEDLSTILKYDLGLTETEKLYVGNIELEQILVPKFLAPVFQRENITSNSTVTESVKNSVRYVTLYKYTNWTDPENIEHIRKNLLRLSSDIFYATPLVNFAEAHSFMNSNTSCYVYEFVHKPSFVKDKPSWITGAGKGAETLFFLGFPASMIGSTEPRLPTNEFVLAEKMMRWTTNFAKTGNPNTPFLLFDDDSEWLRYDSNRSYLRMETNFSTQTHFREPATSFWNILVPALLQNKDKCVPEVTQNVTYDKNKYFTPLHIPSDWINIMLILSICVTLVLFILLLVVTICLIRYRFY